MFLSIVMARENTETQRMVSTVCLKLSFGWTSFSVWKDREWKFLNSYFLTFLKHCFGKVFFNVEVLLFLPLLIALVALQLFTRERRKFWALNWYLAPYPFCDSTQFLPFARTGIYMLFHGRWKLYKVSYIDSQWSGGKIRRNSYEVK